jgi:AbrB family looped-hinge helix DNA binding protein
MVSINITKISSKGQIVIPSGMREDLKEGEEFIIVRDEDRFILKRADKITKSMREDLEFARRTEKAWKEIESGRCTSYSKEEFLKELKDGSE